MKAAEALAHPYLAPYHDPTDEPRAEEKFDWSFNDADLPVDTWKIMMYVIPVLWLRVPSLTSAGTPKSSITTTSMPLHRRSRTAAEIPKRLERRTNAVLVWHDPLL